MSKKTNWTEIRKAAAQRIHTDEKEMTLFLNALTTAVREGLSQSGNVRINGLGTFTVKAIAPRKSVNVQTGEEITIEGYNKVVFTAEAAMKDVLSHVVIDKNPQPKAESKPELPTAPSEQESEDPLKKLGEQAGEILSILADLKAMDGSPTPTLPEGREIGNEGQEESDKGQEESDKGQVTRDKGRGWLWGSTVILILALLGIGGYLYWGYRAENTPHEEIKETDTLCLETDTADINTNTPIEESVVSPERDYSETIEYATLNKGSRLTLLAERYYGSRDLWVFLYEANQEELPSPHRIPVGTRIRIPKLSPEWKDVNNPTTAAEMARLKEIYEAMR